MRQFIPQILQTDRFMEIWKDIAGYGGLYQVSDFGNVRSFAKQKTGKLLVGGFNNGYRVVGLCYGKILKVIKVHRLVAGAFIPNPFNKPEVNHIDANRKNNHLVNLEWVSRKENAEHASGNFLYTHGEDHLHNKLSVANILMIREMSKLGTSQTALSLKFNVAQKTICFIVNRKTWKHLPLTTA